MKLASRAKSADERLEQRICLIAELGRRRDRILEAPEMDLEALAALAADYAAADMPCAAAALRRRLEWYKGSSDGNGDAKS